MNGVMRFGKKGKLSPRHIGPYRISKRIGNVAYELEIPQELAAVHPVFYISMLKKCIDNPSLNIPTKNIGIKDSLSYEEIPIQILDRQVCKLRTKEVASVKVLWRNQFVEEATWEAEEDMKKIYPQLFETGENVDQGLRRKEKGKEEGEKGKLIKIDQRSWCFANDLLLSVSNHQPAGAPRSHAMPPPFGSMSFDGNGFPDLTNMFMNMPRDAFQGQHGPNGSERSNNADSTNEPIIRITRSVNLGFGEQMPEELTGTLRSVMEMFSGAQPPENPRDNMNGRSTPN
ncbi:hypothetical protein MTR67_018947 [Solanum verrucosum]|uniref:Chromo domain-containing protein n=1 Tax=Solanum verrucosum TaxID=315347 RepID=A0AAF0QMR6_SOLVR|nr:hypothetical protein MTR67_018947 [Solanum verrucosum]